MGLQEYRQKLAAIIGAVVAITSWLSIIGIAWCASLGDGIVHRGAATASTVALVLVAMISTAMVRGKDAR